MNKYLILGLIILSSCVTEKKRLKICATCTLKELKTDTIYIEKNEKIVKVNDTITLDNPCKDLCDSAGNLKPAVIYGKNVKLVTNFNRLGIIPDSIKAETEVRKQITYVYKEVESKCKRQHLEGWHKFLIVCGIIFWVTLIIYGAIKLLTH